MLMTDRRTFVTRALAAGLFGLSGSRSLAAENHLRPWQFGELQVHFLYAGSGESIFFIFPDGTSMLVDCGDYDVSGKWKMRNPVTPIGGRGPGKFVADYIRKVNPSDNFVDYWLLTHWHADHGGSETSYSVREERDGEVWFRSGLAELIDDIRFGQGFDRCWPNLGDPFKCKDTSVRQFAQIERTYRWLVRHQDLKIEKFKVGDENQIRLRKNPSGYPDFRILNICGNGVIRTRDGGMRNLYAGFVPKDDQDVWRRENGLSCGFILRYGAFKLFSCGDFQDFWTRPDGTIFNTEDELARELDGVDVAKTNHHASDSMTPALIRALAARVWVTTSVSGYSDWPTTMRRLQDRTIYQGPREICSTYYRLQERRAELGAAAETDVTSDSFVPNHIVLTVPPGGRTYTITRLVGDDSLRVLSCRTLTSKGI